MKDNIVKLRDPLKVKDNFYLEVAELLKDIKANRESPEGGMMTIRERIAAMAMIGRMTLILGLGGENEDDLAGSSVRKYQTAFTAHDARRRKKTARPAAKSLVELGEDGDSDGDNLFGA